MSGVVLLRPCGGTLAYSYFSGYMEILLGNITKNNIEDFCGKHKIELQSKIVILIPENCQPPVKLDDYDSENIEHFGQMLIYADVGGIRNRAYGVDVFKITFDGDSIYVMMNSPASLVTIHKMKEYRHMRIEREDVEKAKEEFMSALNSLILLDGHENFEIIRVTDDNNKVKLGEKIYKTLKENPGNN
jgi:hypothetical protein